MATKLWDVYHQNRLETGIIADTSDHKVCSKTGNLIQSMLQYAFPFQLPATVLLCWANRSMMKLYIELTSEVEHQSVGV